MERRYQYQPTPNFFRILVEIDRDLLARIDAFAEEREESRQALLGRFVEGGLKRERRRLRGQGRGAYGARGGAYGARGGAPQATVNARRPDSRHDRVSPTPSPREVS